ncbi:acyl-CoA thioesterase [Variovorax sp. PAMC 28711]|uniref:acyl-CoA thioesterase n=1 Tax=Variovorax sp. PAMC 28711 TaxID=1795631 RepID=UPI00078E152E|nr:thioesterase family protein [Variovorax sp. PAMC 28711]AMM24174.1 acyl-CoA thioesterase [Variovorax sp. PAMC 28711]
MTEHPFDQAIALAQSDIRAGQFTGATSPHYWNMVGPFGGTTAAVVLQSVLDHPDLLGLPIALTVNYAAALVAGPFEVLAIPVRTNRSTQHWTIQITQPDDGGAPQVNTTATVVTAARRETWGTNDLPMPSVPRPGEVARFSSGPAGVAWMGQYEMRPVSGVIPGTWDGSGDRSESIVWLRDAVPRALDFASLACLSDMFYPRIWLRRAKHVPAGTVSITTYFHAGVAELESVGTGYLLGRAVGQQFHNGFFDQSAQLWSEAGALLATSNQIVYFKE